MNQNLFKAVIAIISISFFFSCKKTIIETPDSVKKIYVSNVEQLYSAVNDTSRVGYVVVMAAGTYLLSANYPHNGRIELQNDMSLQGQTGHPEQVIIDVTGLPNSSFTIPPTPSLPLPVRTGAIRTGNGNNIIEWLTVQNDTAHVIRSLIQTDIVATPTAKVKIAHNILKGSAIGINVINRDAVSNSRVVHAELVDNQILNNTILPFGAGIQIQNSQAVNGASIEVTMNGNIIQGNRMGIVGFNGSAIDNSIKVKSNNDKIEDNGVGIVMFAGWSENASLPTLNNTTIFEAYGTIIRRNSGTPATPFFFTAGGVYAAGAAIPAVVVPGTAHNNKLDASFNVSPIENNTSGYQINAFGAVVASTTSTPAGTNNTATIHLNGVSKEATVKGTPSVPLEAAGTNQIIIDK